MTTTAPLTVPRALILAEIINSAAQQTKVARLVDGEPVTGTARALTDEAGSYNHPYDVRDAYLRVTGDVAGIEYLWPVAELIEEHLEGRFYANLTALGRV